MGFFGAAAYCRRVRCSFSLITLGLSTRSNCCNSSSVKGWASGSDMECHNGKANLRQVRGSYRGCRERSGGAGCRACHQEYIWGVSNEERSEYEQIVRFNDLLSLLKLQAEEYWAPRIAS